MGDAAFGMIGMDFETAVRARIPILTIVLNNGLMGGYGQWMPDAVDRYASNRLGGDYAAVGRALGGHTERVGEPAELRPALERCDRRVAAGQTRAARGDDARGARAGAALGGRGRFTALASA